ncbi:MAG: glycosyltransferase family 4 protein [Microgenomates group bacterium]
MAIKKQKKTVVIVLDEFITSGITTFIHSYSRYLLSTGLEVVLIGKSKNESWIAQKFHGCTLYTFSETKTTNLLGEKLATYIQSFFWYAKVFRKVRLKHSILAVHFNQVLSAFGILLFSPSVYKYKRIYTFHGDRAHELKSEHIQHPIRTLHIAVMKHLQNFVFQRCSTVVAVSLYGLKRLRELRAPNSRYIPNGILVDTTDTGNIKKERKLQHMQYHCINISRFEPRKGHILFLNAISQLLQKDVHIQTTIAGPVSSGLLPILYEYERLKLTSHIQFCYQPDTETQEIIFRTADLFIMPSIELENCPFTIIESLARGVPVIGTPVGGIPEMLEKIDARLIAKQATPEALARTIKWYLQLPASKKQKIQIACKITARTYYNAAINYKKYVRLYREK